MDLQCTTIHKLIMAQYEDLKKIINDLVIEKYKLQQDCNLLTETITDLEEKNTKLQEDSREVLKEKRGFQKQISDLEDKIKNLQGEAKLFKWGQMLIENISKLANMEEKDFDNLYQVGLADPLKQSNMG